MHDDRLSGLALAGTSPFATWSCISLSNLGEPNWTLRESFGALVDVSHCGDCTPHRVCRFCEELLDYRSIDEDPKPSSTDSQLALHRFTAVLHTITRPDGESRCSEDWLEPSAASVTDLASSTWRSPLTLRFSSFLLLGRSIRRSDTPCSCMTMHYGGPGLLPYGHGAKQERGRPLGCARKFLGQAGSNPLSQCVSLLIHFPYACKAKYVLILQSLVP